LLREDCGSAHEAVRIIEDYGYRGLESRDQALGQSPEAGLTVRLRPLLWLTHMRDRGTCEPKPPSPPGRGGKTGSNSCTDPGKYAGYTATVPREACEISVGL